MSCTFCRALCVSGCVCVEGIWSMNRQEGGVCLPCLSLFVRTNLSLTPQQVRTFVESRDILSLLLWTKTKKAFGCSHSLGTARCQKESSQVACVGGLEGAMCLKAVQKRQENACLADLLYVQRVWTQTRTHTRTQRFEQIKRKEAIKTWFALTWNVATHTY